MIKCNKAHNSTRQLQSTEIQVVKIPHLAWNSGSVYPSKASDSDNETRAGSSNEHWQHS